MEVTEKPSETFYPFEINMTDEERMSIIEYAMDNISQEELDDLILEWAMLDMIKRAANEVLENKS